MAREVLPGLAINSVAKHTTGRHDGEKKGGDDRNKELNDAKDECERACLATATVLCDGHIKGRTTCQSQSDEQEDQAVGEVGCIIPSEWDIRKRRKRGGDHDYRCCCPTEGSDRPRERM